MPKPPPIFPIRKIDLPSLEHHRLSNGLSCYHINQGTQEVVRIEFVCYGGRPYELHPLVARTTTSQLREGLLSGRNGAAIAEYFDYYGAHLAAPFQMDTGNLAMHALNKQLPHVLPLFVELLSQPAFPEDALRTYVQRKQQSLREDTSRAEVVAYRKITEYIFGEDHPYGYNSNEALFAQLQADWLHQHHGRCYHANNGFVLISGHFSEETLQYIHHELEQIVGRAAPTAQLPEVTTTPAQRIHLPHQFGEQTAIRIGRRLFSRNHPDADGFYVLAQLLGGYFGSRLMANIREDKGYTYGITAAYDPFRYDGTFQIDAEVSPEYVDGTLHEVKHEIDRLQQDLVPAEELEMLRNYLMGTYLAMVDGPFSWAATVRTLLTERLQPEAFLALVQTTQTIGPEALRELAQKYLREEDLWSLSVG